MKHNMLVACWFVWAFVMAAGLSIWLGGIAVLHWLSQTEYIPGIASGAGMVLWSCMLWAGLQAIKEISDAEVKKAKESEAE